MATKSNFPNHVIGSNNPKMYNRLRTVIETAFYRNNVINVNSIQMAYDLAYNAKGTIVTSQLIEKPETVGLKDGSRVLLFNDGNVTGRQASLRKLVNDQNRDSYANIAREVTFLSKDRKMYHAQAYIGLDPQFMVKAHLLVPEGYENTLFSWLLNFQSIDNEVQTKMYQESVVFDEGDIYIYSDPDMYYKGYENGLALFDASYNCALLLGMRYFGEHKKGTLTLAWSIGERNGFTACHGGQKRFILENGKTPVIGVFGLSGSGKSMLTLSDHDGRLKTTVLHDDAFVINNDDCSSIALELSYFDKTQDYPLTNPQSKYFLTVQNCGATLNCHNEVVLVTGDVCSGNGRAVKSHLATPNREYVFNTPIDAIFWIMKDSSLPPLLKVKSPELASVFGATLATMRSSAEQVAKEELNKLVIVPYANPFRLYELKKDYQKFYQLFAEKNVDCYIINTGYFWNGDNVEKKVTPKINFDNLEDVVLEAATFKPFGPFKEISYLPVEGFTPDFSNDSYTKVVKERLIGRLNFLNNLDSFDQLPQEAVLALQKLIEQI